MSVSEIIEQIKSLPPAEREKVADFIREMDADPFESRSTKPRPTIDQLADRIFDQYDELFGKLTQ
jgi:hypothetical protein